MSFQLTNISGDIPKLKESKIYNFSLTRIGEKRKRTTAEPIETVIIHAQQNFEIPGGLNLVQTEIEDDRVLNILKKHKNVNIKKVNSVMNVIPHIYKKRH